VTVHLLVPAGFAERPSGGNVYDRRVRAGLVGLSLDVATHEVTTSSEVAAALPTVPDGSVVLVDGLVASWAADDLLVAAPRLRLVPLVHMVFETPGERELLTAAPVVLTTSSWSRRWLAEHYDLDPARLHVAVPGVELSEPAPGTETGGELLCVAAVLPAKGQDVLLAALATLTDLSWRCRLVGPLSLDPDFVDELHKAAAGAGIADRVLFTGTLAHDSTRAAYAGADLLVLPSRAESYGMVVTEALAHAVPVLASSVGGVPEALGHGDDGSTPGLLVRPGDPHALAGALREWLEDPRRRQRLRRTAALRRLTLPTWSRTTAQVAAALEAAR
jgi:glycosyltransferase involved in cell wall biosynthesis